MLTFQTSSSREAVLVHDGDLPIQVLRELRQGDVVAWDIETSGLDFRTERIGLCQLVTPGGTIHIIRVGANPCPNMARLLNDERIRKVFHHAMFDLRFMRFHWSAVPRNVACTKIASKILNPGAADHSLKRLMREFLGVELDKSQRTSDWLANTLSNEQLAYAAADVRHLVALHDRLQVELQRTSSAQLAQACFDYLPTRVELDLRGAGDVFVY